MNGSIHQSEVAQFVSNNWLENLIPQSPTQTYHNGSSCIDYALGTTRVKAATIEAGCFPFDMGPFDSDHRALYIDIYEKYFSKE